MPDTRIGLGRRVEAGPQDAMTLDEATALAARWLEAQVRERVAQEIKAWADRFEASALSIGRGSLNDYDTGALDAAHYLARITRGGAS